MIEYILHRKIYPHIYDNVTFILNLDFAVLLYPILFQTVCFPYGSSGREVEYQISYSKTVSSIPVRGVSFFYFHQKNLWKSSGKLQKIFR